MENQSQYNQMNNQSTGMQNANRGGHELLDMHEVLSCTIGVLDQFMIYKSFVKDNELMTIMNRQYNFILSQYNLTVECYTTGQKPSQDTTMYTMPQAANQLNYGITPSQPKKPIQSVNEIKDAQISGFMLGELKATASHMTIAALEVTNPVVRRVVAAQIENYIEMAYEIFLYQNKHGYYQVPQLDQADAQAMLRAYAPATGQPQIPMQ